MFIFNNIYLTKLRLIYSVKRIFIFLSMFFFNNHNAISQDFSFSDPYSEKILLNPSYSGLSKCPEIDLNYKMNLFNNLFSFSYNQNLSKHNSGFAFLLYNNRQGKGSINNLSVSGIYSYKININERKLINTALQVSYFQQNINTDKLIFSDQIDPISGLINQVSSESGFRDVKTYDFSVGTSFLSHNYRTGLSVQHIDKFFLKDKNNLLNPAINFNFGKIFSVKKEQYKSQLFIIPEVIYNFQNNFHQIIYAVHIINNIFLTRFYLKHNIKFNTLASIISLGLNYRNVRISYIYEINFARFITIPISYNQISLKYKFNCSEKRKFKNTIYCSDF